MDGVDIWIYVFLTSTLICGECPVSRSDSFTPGERTPGTDWIGGWMDLRTDLNDAKKRKILPLPGLELRPLGRPARSQSLCRVHYPVSL
jgi:hypothetical protein